MLMGVKQLVIPYLAPAVMSNPNIAIINHSHPSIARTLIAHLSVTQGHVMARKTRLLGYWLHHDATGAQWC